MSEYVEDCPRCGATKVTFDIMAAHRIKIRHGWQYWYEAFSVCRHCHRSTVFVLADDARSNYEPTHNIGLENIDGFIN